MRLNRTVWPRVVLFRHRLEFAIVRGALLISWNVFNWQENVENCWSRISRWIPPSRASFTQEKTNTWVGCTTFQQMIICRWIFVLLTRLSVKLSQVMLVVFRVSHEQMFSLIFALALEFFHVLFYSHTWYVLSWNLAIL